MSERERERESERESCACVLLVTHVSTLLSTPGGGYQHFCAHLRACKHSFMQVCILWGVSERGNNLKSWEILDAVLVAYLLLRVTIDGGNLNDTLELQK